MSEAVTETLDARRLLCPMPVIRTQNRIRGMNTGEVLEVICTDPGTLEDIPAWCRIHQHEVVAINRDDSTISFTIKVG